ncbi:MAG: serine hydrolase [Bacteroidetes bacterium]|jgi:D-alanyl-D-alanine carboxypeptidase|nr:serine hydrolase [Bacteroidota bacterium]
MSFYGLHRPMLIVGLMLFGGMCGTAAAQSPSPVVAALQTTLDSLWTQDAFPGATAAVVLPDGTLHAAATGYADREDATRMPPDARMLSGSTGKSFAAAVVLALAQEDRLDLDAPIARWLGDRPWFDRLPNAEALTLRHLLRHQSGLRDHIHDEDFLTAVRERMAADGPDAAFAPEELVAFVLDAEPLFAAGAGYHYSDTNYLLAGLIVEAVTDSAYYDVLQERLLDPLHLAATTPADRRDLPGLVAGYVEGEAPFGLPPKVTQDGTLVYNPATEWTGGGLVTTASDLARWAHRLYTGEALPGDYLDELLAAVPKDATQQAHFGADVRYGLGVTIRSTELGTAYGHRGWTPGYLSIFEYYPAHEIAVAVQVNALGPYDLSAYAVRLAHTARAAAE